ncbi:hypothetical protein FF011L_39400 [Roseimaritima multifibrata]|uniref:Uncharacterized protein n=1 Tax=Roseimaritima multifibrata TaxID=1930274 RepID=A0A517MJU7_9BACT|nr:hypothetical protein [Roseimaritima multifibrata]QDS95153.1 hypothetical protein FF011L_39400 [Roseimaritima multifibrata]
MRNRIFIAGILFATCLLPTVWANSEISQEKKEEVRYRCVEWQTKHIHEADQAKKISKTLTDLKCEVKQEQHNGHVDLKYRCPEWRRMLLDSHDDAHKWEKWLKTYGFQTEHHH